MPTRRGRYKSTYHWSYLVSRSCRTRKWKDWYQTVVWILVSSFTPTVCLFPLIMPIYSILTQSGGYRLHLVINHPNPSLCQSHSHSIVVIGRQLLRHSGLQPLLVLHMKRSSRGKENIIVTTSLVPLLPPITRCFALLPHQILGYL